MLRAMPYTSARPGLASVKLGIAIQARAGYNLCAKEQQPPNAMPALTKLLAPLLWILACGLQMLVIHIAALAFSPRYRGIVALQKAQEAKKRGQHYEAAALCRCPACNLYETCRNRQS